MSKPPKKPVANSSMPNNLFPGESADIQKDIATLIDDPSKWLDTPHARLGGAKPKDLIGADREQFLRDLLRSIKYGMPT
jgi:uncharacterized protein (DUF2384 family)